MWRKISIWKINFNLVIQKSKLKRNRQDEINYRQRHPKNPYIKHIHIHKQPPSSQNCVLPNTNTIDQKYKHNDTNHFPIATLFGHQSIKTTLIQRKSCGPMISSWILVLYALYSNKWSGQLYQICMQQTSVHARPMLWLMVNQWGSSCSPKELLTTRLPGRLLLLYLCSGSSRNNCLGLGGNTYAP